MQTDMLTTKKEKLINDLMDLFADKTTYITKEYLKKTTEVCKLFREAYILPLLEGKDKLAPIKFINKKKKRDNLAGIYITTDKAVTIYLNSLAELPSPTGGKVHKQDEFFDKPIAKEDPVWLKEIKQKDKSRIQKFYNARNKIVLDMFNTIAHEDHHSFQDKFMFFHGGQRNWDVLGLDGDQNRKDAVKAARRESRWKRRAGKEECKVVYGSIVRYKEAMTAQKLRDSFDRKERKLENMFLYVHTVLNGWSERECVDFAKGMNDAYYIMSLHERDARRSGIRGLRSLFKDVYSFAQTQQNREKKELAMEIWEVIERDIKREFSSRNGYTLTDEYGTLEMKGARQMLDEFHQAMKNCTVEDFVRYAEGICGEYKELQKRFLPFADVVKGLRMCQYTQHLFTKENREKMYKLLKEKGLNDFAAVVGGEDEGRYDEDEGQAIE